MRTFVQELRDNIQKLFDANRAAEEAKEKKASALVVEYVDLIKQKLIIASRKGLYSVKIEYGWNDPIRPALGPLHDALRSLDLMVGPCNWVQGSNVSFWVSFD